MAAGRKTDRLFPGLDDLGNENERSLAVLEPAWAKAALAFRTGNRLGHGSHSIRCGSLVEVYTTLDVYQRRFKAGDTLSLLQAISVCAEENLPLPEWLALAFRDRLTAFGRPGGAASLDHVFSSKALPTSSPKKAAQARLDWQLGVRLWLEAWDLVQADASISSIDGVITRLLSTKRYGVEKTKAKQLITMVDEGQAEFLRTDTLSQFLKKRRKAVT